MASGFTVPRFTTDDPVVEAMRLHLYDLLTPEQYDLETVRKMEEKIVKHLEARNARDRLAYNALTVAGYTSETWLEAA